MADFRQAVYVISVAAELSGMHPQTLRIYERKGLLEPTRTPGGSRRYSDSDVALLLRIQELTNDGLNLAGVKKVLELEKRLALVEQRRAEELSQYHEALENLRRSNRRDLVPLSQAVAVFDSLQNRKR